MIVSNSLLNTYSDSMVPDFHFSKVVMKIRHLRAETQAQKDRVIRSIQRLIVEAAEGQAGELATPASGGSKGPGKAPVVAVASCPLAAETDSWCKALHSHAYRRCFSGPLGSTIGDGVILYNSAGDDSITIRLPDAFSNSLAPADLLALIGKLVSQFPAMVCKHVELCFNHVQFSPKQALEAATEGLISCAAKKPKAGWAAGFRQNLQGDTIYFGKRNSPRQLRLYDRRGYSRMELVYRNSTAQAALNLLKGSHDLYQTAVGLVQGFVKFQRPTATRATSWWRSFVGDHQVIHLPIVHRKHRLAAQPIKSS